MNKEKYPIKIDSFENEEINISPEKRREFEAVIVLGKNWREYPPKDASPKDWRLHLSIESKMSALAAGVMFREGLVDKIIFSTGKTAGKDWPSEAEAMRDFLKSKFGEEIPDEAIILEEESIDTPQNAEKVREVLEKNKIKNVALLTCGFHLPRAEKIFRNFKIETSGFVSEELLKKRSPHYEKLVGKYLGSGRVKTEEIKEFILKTLLKIDPHGKLPHILAKKIRHG